jgi:5-methylcytosine-specific restriction endonuclease McrA
VSSRKITDSIQQQVRQRALELCEYCHASEKWQYVLFTVDHVIPLSKDGKNTIDNLALACFHCNRRKSNNLTAIDPDSGNQVALFNPRKNLWNEHFIWSTDGLIIEKELSIFVLLIKLLIVIHLQKIPFKNR